jgi:hypothetical protein
MTNLDFTIFLALLTHSVVLKTAVIDNILHWAMTKADQQIKKTDGSKRNRLVLISRVDLDSRSFLIM